VAATDHVGLASRATDEVPRPVTGPIVDPKAPIVRSPGSTDKKSDRLQPDAPFPTVSSCAVHHPPYVAVIQSAGTTAGNHGSSLEMLKDMVPRCLVWVAGGLKQLAARTPAHHHVKKKRRNDFLNRRRQRPQRFLFSTRRDRSGNHRQRPLRAKANGDRNGS
jgi:hypothetical protein